MEVDQNVYFKIVLDKTTTKLNELQARVILLESQLQIALEANEKLNDDFAKINKKEKKSEFTN